MLVGRQAKPGCLRNHAEAAMSAAACRETPAQPEHGRRPVRTTLAATFKKLTRRRLPRQVEKAPGRPSTRNERAASHARAAASYCTPDE